MAESNLGGLSILVVEDSPLLRKQVVASLEKLGADVTAAADLAAARRFVAELGFDFAILDVNLPDGLGTDLLRDKVFPLNTGAVIMTSNADVAIFFHILERFVFFRKLFIWLLLFYYFIIIIFNEDK